MLNRINLILEIFQLARVSHLDGRHTRAQLSKPRLQVLTDTAAFVSFLHGCCCFAVHSFHFTFYHLPFFGGASLFILDLSVVDVVFLSSSDDFYFCSCHLIQCSANNCASCSTSQTNWHLFMNMGACYSFISHPFHQHPFPILPYHSPLWLVWSWGGFIFYPPSWPPQCPRRFVDRDEKDGTTSAQAAAFFLPQWESQKEKAVMNENDKIRNENDPDRQAADMHLLHFLYPPPLLSLSSIYLSFSCHRSLSVHLHCQHLRLLLKLLFWFLLWNVWRT